MFELATAGTTAWPTIGAFLLLLVSLVAVSVFMVALGRDCCRCTGGRADWDSCAFEMPSCYYDDSDTLQCLCADELDEDEDAADAGD